MSSCLRGSSEGYEANNHAHNKESNSYANWQVCQLPGLHARHIGCSKVSSKNGITCLPKDEKTTNNCTLVLHNEVSWFLMNKYQERHLMNFIFNFNFNFSCVIFKNIRQFLSWHNRCGPDSRDHVTAYLIGFQYGTNSSWAKTEETCKPGQETVIRGC